MISRPAVSIDRSSGDAVMLWRSSASRKQSSMDGQCYLVGPVTVRAAGRLGDAGVGVGVAIVSGADHCSQSTS